ncbi:hypothetical protein HOV04_gp02 [Xanthomonas phage XcP1]|uniref:Uncharacterized protein n=1 Tax=Xanthomonas phage XcP1 TaxID=2785027 RepID=A0A3S7L8H3_9CAUD|nr:hypothetical protein HOV04_gp02 [Xanthomonas phage XcP1]AWN08504.1 hypothetical protein XcP1_002 [Xanthomonas phage XcP1]
MSEFKAGDLVRYGVGSTALMVLRSPHPGGRGWHGVQCMGGVTFAPWHKIKQPSPRDYKTWQECEKWRNPAIIDQTIVEPADINQAQKPLSSGYKYQEPVIDFDGSDLAASGGVRTMQGVAFTDTPEATRDQQDSAGDAEQSAPEPITPKDSLSINKLVNVIADPAHPKKSDVPDEADDATVEVVQIVVVASAIVSLVVTSIVIGISAAIWHAMN